MLKNLAQRLNNLRHQAEWIGIREVKETTQQCVARNGNFEQNTTTFDHGIMVEVLVDGQFAYCATDNLSDSALQNACDRATQLAKAMASWKIYSFDVTHRPMGVGDYHSSPLLSLHTTKVSEVIEPLLAATKKMKISNKIINCSAQALLCEQEMTLVSSSGSQVHQHISSVASHLSVTAQEGLETQTRTTGVPCHQGGLELLNRDVFEQEAERLGREALELLSAEPCPTGIYDLILAPDQLMMQVHESIGHPLELDRILGDERNYAGWSFINLSDFGHLQYGSPLLNVIFDPNDIGEYASYGFDDTGLIARKRYLIKDGVLVAGLGGIDSQRRSGVPGVASTRASSWNRPPIDRMANLNIEPGNASWEEMIASVERGVYMTTNSSWSIDDYRRKFQFGCEYAKLIENGKFTKTLRNPNYRGMTTQFWKNLKRVGNSSTFERWGSPYCGKGEPNQMIKVGHAVPTCLFENIEVFGGAA